MFKYKVDIFGAALLVALFAYFFSMQNSAIERLIADDVLITSGPNERPISASEFFGYRSF